MTKELMTKELKPWLDADVPSELRRLLVAASTQEPTRGEVHRVMAQLALADAASSHGQRVEPFEGSGAGSVIAGAKWPLLGGSLLGVLAIGAAVVGAQHLAASPSPTASVAPAANLADPRLETFHRLDRQNPPEPASDLSPEPTTTIPAHKLHTAPGVWGKVPAASARAGVPAPSSTAVKTQTVLPSRQSYRSPSYARLAPDSELPELPSQGTFIDRARGSLKRNNPGEALRILDEYDAAFRTRTFDPEALQLRLRASVRLGDSGAAKRVAEILARRYPGTPQGKEALDFLGR